jgi:septal ring factor EnvC (AmiA/AmiB activator)
LSPYDWNSTSAHNLLHYHVPRVLINPLFSSPLLLNRLREHELKVEDLERKVKSLEKENETLETKLEEMTEKHNIAKAELDETLKAMDDM